MQSFVLGEFHEIRTETGNGSAAQIRNIQGVLPSVVVTAAPNEVKHKCQDQENLGARGEFM